MSEKVTEREGMSGIEEDLSEEEEIQEAVDEVKVIMLNVCSTCQKSFPSKGNLVRHQKTHLPKESLNFYWTAQDDILFAELLKKFPGVYAYSHQNHLKQKKAFKRKVMEKIPRITRAKTVENKIFNTKIAVLRNKDVPECFRFLLPILKASDNFAASPKYSINKTSDNSPASFKRSISDQNIECENFVCGICLACFQNEFGLDNHLKFKHTNISRFYTMKMPVIDGANGKIFLKKILIIKW